MNAILHAWRWKLLWTRWEDRDHVGIAFSYDVDLATSAAIQWYQSSTSATHSRVRCKTSPSKNVPKDIRRPIYLSHKIALFILSWMNHKQANYEDIPTKRGERRRRRWLCHPHPTCKKNSHLQPTSTSRRNKNLKGPQKAFQQLKATEIPQNFLQNYCRFLEIILGNYNI